MGSGDDLRDESARLRYKVDLVLTGLSNAGLIELHRNSQGEIDGINVSVGPQTIAAKGQGSPSHRPNGPARNHSVMRPRAIACEALQSGGMEHVLGFSIDADGGERLRFSDAEFTVKVSAGSTHGAFTVIEEANPLDTPLHVHKNEDELWYVLEGEHVIQVGDDEFRVGPGGMVFGPRGVPHAQRRIVPRTGRFLEFYSPAGFDGFFRELSEAETSGASMPEAYARVSEKYGVTWL